MTYRDILNAVDQINLRRPNAIECWRVWQWKITYAVG